MPIDVKFLEQKFPQFSDFQPIDVGGQKTVYKISSNDHGVCALKIMLPGVSLDRIKREIETSLRISHQRVPKVLAFGEIASPMGEMFWTAEHFIDGQNLRKVLVNGPLKHSDVVRMCAQILEILVESEKLGIVHRDIKPENIMLDSQGAFWLLDFGIARNLQQISLTATASPIGPCTPGYAPVEQFRNIKNEVDCRADLFGLGVTVYECATGANPFRQNASDEMEMLRRVELEQLPELELDVPNSEEFTKLIWAMTRTRRNHRLRTADRAFKWISEIQ